MHADALSGGFINAPHDAAHGFRAALNALSRPGRIETITGARAPTPVSPAAAPVVVVLCDPETPIHLAGDHDTADIRAWIAFHIGAPVTGPEPAAFALGTWQAMSPLHRFSIGSAEYPDRAATLIVETATLAQTGARLSGPGIETVAYLSLPETQAFQDNRALFPQGLDFFLTAGDQIAGLPRSTIVEAM